MTQEPGLELAHPLPREVDHPADLLQRVGAVPLDSEAQAENLRLARLQPFDRRLDALLQFDLLHPFQRRGTFRVLHRGRRPVAVDRGVQAAGLEETLRGAGPYTVFAPTDDAFAAVPQETMDALLADPSGALTDVLTYHVVPGKVMSTDLSDGMMAETVNGESLKITINDDGTVMVGDATVVTADIETANGVIHVIDTVLVP